jgi:hypothetical protein
MIFKITPENNEYYEKILKESMDILNTFYEIHWVHHLPKIIVVDDRKSIDLLQSEKTEPWQIGWAEGRSVYVLDKDSLEKESDHTYTPETYHSLIRHEISHTFYSIVSGGNRKPIWLCEGVAIYTAGQNVEKTKPTEFKTFLDFYNNGGSGVYAESGFVVQLLVEKFGKDKLLELIKGLKSVDTSDTFEKFFEKIYGFLPTYEKFNGLYRQ